VRLELEPITLECGLRLPSLHVEAWEGGDPKGPVALVVHALTGDAEVGTWWPEVVADGLSGNRVLCFNNLGSCYGTSGPGEPDFPTRGELNGTDPAFASEPAPISTWDQARVLLLALDALQVERVQVLIGGSVGGMIAQCLAVLAPERFERVILLATSATANAWTLAWNHLGRTAIRRHGDLDLARQVAHLSYRAEPGLQARQGTKRWKTHGESHVGTYLAHHGKKLVERFTPGAYLSQLDAMDSHDIWRRPAAPDPHESWTLDGTWGLDRWTADLLAVGIDTDQLFRPEHLQDLVGILRKRGVSATYREVENPHGHDGFLLATTELNHFLRTHWSPS